MGHDEARAAVVRTLGAQGAAAARQPLQDPHLEAWVAALQARYGARLCAVLLYGSYQRGARDSLTDFYVLLDGLSGAVPAYQALLGTLLPPNVYQQALPDGSRAKLAVLPLARFTRCCAGDFHSYFWARFAQEVRVLWCRQDAEAQLDAALAAAVVRFLDAASCLVPAPASTASLWRTGLAATYRCELRAESPDRGAELVARGLPVFEPRTRAWASARGYGDTEPYAGWHEGGSLRWALRRWWGKGLSILRLVKASATFNDGLDYLLWKIERHSGIYLEPTAAQRRWPLLLAWPLFFRLYRLGAFR